MSDQRDPVIGPALDAVPVPEYDPGFWDRLEARLDEERPDLQPGSPLQDNASPADADPGLAELGPAVTPLPARARAPHRHRRLLLVAAAAALVALVVTVQLRPGEDQVQTASPPDATATTDVGASPPPAHGLAETTLLAWLDAIGAGDIDETLQLTGPRTVAYYDALGADMAGVALEWGEGYGAWAEVDDRTTAVVPLGEVQGHAVVVVTISGTWQGEGTTGYRTDAIPVVQAEDGTWSAEPAAFDPTRDGRLELTSPPPGETGLGSIDPDGFVEVISGGQGTYHFVIDSGAAVAVPAGDEGTPVRFDPPGLLGNGTHQLLVAQVDDQNITAQAHTFTVEE